MFSSEQLKAIKQAAAAAEKSARLLEKCHDSFIRQSQSGFSRARTTSYNARSSALAAHAKSDQRYLTQLVTSVWTEAHSDIQTAGE